MPPATLNVDALRLPVVTPVTTTSESGLARPASSMTPAGVPYREPRMSVGFASMRAINAGEA